MDNPFSKSGNASAVSARHAHSEAKRRFSPSYGVHKGYIKDPNWPPAHFPEDGVAAARRYRRVVVNFEVEFDGVKQAVQGDLSAGGAMFLLPAHRNDTQVVVILKGVRARAEVLSVSPKGALFAHHCHFIDATEGQALFEAVSS